jgi:Major Facilitator Superfamily
MTLVASLDRSGGRDGNDEFVAAADVTAGKRSGSVVEMASIIKVGSESRPGSLSPLESSEQTEQEDDGDFEALLPAARGPSVGLENRHGDRSSVHTAIGSRVDSHHKKSCCSCDWSTIALCCCMLTHSYLLISVVPYSGYMAVVLLSRNDNDHQIDADHVGSYAGFIAAAFMFGRCCTSILWGVVADTYGRTTVLIASLVLLSVSSICFGFVTSYSFVLIIRFVMGMSNGIMATVKTLVSEIASKNNLGKEVEARNMALVIGFWGWGFLIAPILSGALAEPVTQYPGDSSGLFDWDDERYRFWRNLLTRFPFLLPNVLGTIFCLCCLGLVVSTLPETLPPEKRLSLWQSPQHARHWIQKRVHLCCPSSFVACLFRGYQRIPASQQYIKAHDSGDFHDEECDYDGEEEGASGAKDDAEVTMSSLWANDDTRACMCLHWCFSFLSISLDESMPLFCMSKTSGFALTEVQIGKIMSLCGLLFAVSQYTVHSVVYGRFGLFGSIKVGSCCAFLIFLVPLSVILNRGAPPGQLRWSTFLLLAAILGSFRALSLVFFSSLSVAANRTVPDKARATMNGLCMLGGSIANGLGPAFAVRFCFC